MESFQWWLNKNLQTSMQWIPSLAADLILFTYTYESIADLIHDPSIPETAKPNSKKSRTKSKLNSTFKANSTLFIASNTLLTVPETHWNKNQVLTLQEHARTIHGLTIFFPETHTIIHALLTSFVDRFVFIALR